MEFTQFAWRDGVLLIAVAAGIYLAITLLRLISVGNRKARESALDLGGALPAAGGNAAASGWAATDALSFHFPLTSTIVNTVSERVEVTPVAAPAEAAPSFNERLVATQLERDVRDLRTEVAALREELMELETSRRVSPQYADAMALARRGFDAQGIAEHCAISRGEAELVMALAHGPSANEGADTLSAGVPGPARKDYAELGFRGIAA